MTATNNLRWQITKQTSLSAGRHSVWTTLSKDWTLSNSPISACRCFQSNSRPLDHISVLNENEEKILKVFNRIKILKILDRKNYRFRADYFIWNEWGQLYESWMNLGNISLWKQQIWEPQGSWGCFSPTNRGRNSEIWIPKLHPASLELILPSAGGTKE